MGRRVEEARALEQSRRVGEPHGVPVGFDFARRGPARACATVEVLKRGRVQKECFQGHWHLFHSNISGVFRGVFAVCCLFCVQFVEPVLHVAKGAEEIEARPGEIEAGVDRVDVVLALVDAGLLLGGG